MNNLELFFALSISLCWLVASTTVVFNLLADDYSYSNTPPLGSRAANELETAKYAEEPKAKSTLDKVYSKLETLMMKLV